MPGVPHSSGGLIKKSTSSPPPTSLFPPEWESPAHAQENTADSSGLLQTYTLTSEGQATASVFLILSHSFLVFTVSFIVVILATVLIVKSVINIHITICKILHHIHLLDSF